MSHTSRRAAFSAARTGFTLIELLITIVIIGILASIALSQLGDSKNSAIQASMISDLKNLAVGQERAYLANGTYLATGSRTTDGQGASTGTVAAPLATFAPSKGNTVTLLTGDGQVWSAEVTNVALPATAKCSIAGGVGKAGIPTCASMP